MKVNGSFFGSVLSSRNGFESRLKTLGPVRPNILIAYTPPFPLAMDHIGFARNALALTQSQMQGLASWCEKFESGSKENLQTRVILGARCQKFALLALPKGPE
jgi:hypothetical protein